MTQFLPFSGRNRKFNRNKLYSTIIVCSQCDREGEYRRMSQRPHLRNLTKVLMLFFRDHKATPISPLIFLQTGNQSLIFKKIISQQPQEVNLLFLYHCTDRYLSKNIYKSDPIWPLLPVQTGSQSLIFRTNHISTTTRGKLTIFAPLYRLLIVEKHLQKGDPNLTWLPVQTGSQTLIFKKIISQQPQEVNSQFFALLYRLLIVQNVYKNMTPIWPSLSV